MYKHFQPPKGRKAYMGNQEEFISFENGIATIKLKMNDNAIYHLYLHAEIDELHVACTCGMPGEKLCFHAFITLYYLTWFSERFSCQRLYWPGFYSYEAAQRFLNIEILRGKICVEAKPEYGALYRSGISLEPYGFPALTEHSSNKFTIKAGGTAVYAYALCYAPDAFRNRHYPVLIPFYGKTNKTGLNVDTFSSFVLLDRGPKQNNDHLYYQQLNAYSKTMYELMRPLTYKSDAGDKQLWRQAEEAILSLWQKALLLLVDCPYNHSYLLYHFRYLREKPAKRFMRPCRYSLERPSLRFLLTIHRDYLKLSVEVTVGSRVVPVAHKPHLFIFDEEAGYCHLMSSMEDDELLNWMLDHGNRITALTENFEEFDNDVLGKLAARHPVFFSDRNKSRLAYDRNVVKAKISQ
ncbi:hypothetical protein HH214_18430 [Mucilaginibacter robiniae]|uniref:SWIM-type domain-containing protein n=1 Tax=Mucilaginibacter robiniae TaxID=2728022 RepID=A0A7L5E5W4_9SPHI|nr:hypothetical protein [Mucilaginibacter robiniae]QJD97709.1 hypothetical protein HH214_18430 [Mucilaginibacter robiniae]